MSWDAGLQPFLRPYARWLVAQFPGVQITSVWRSWSTQARLYRNRSRSPYPAAPPGQSKHQVGLAWDMVGDPATLAQAGALWNRMGGRWSPSDEIHFEF